MKKLISTAIMMVFFFAAWAQEEQTFEKNMNKHEFRIDALELLAIPNIDIQYEYALNKYSGFGLAMTYSLDDSYSEYQHYSINPYFRQYFFNKKDFGARGFFVEGLLKFAGGEDYWSYDTTGFEIDRKDWFNVGAGVVLGQKWVSDNGFVLEISAGGGRYLLNNDGPKGFFRGGISIGYRFF